MSLFYYQSNGHSAVNRAKILFFYKESKKLFRYLCKTEMEKDRPVIYLFTDGAASGNPGPGGYGVVMKCAVEGPDGQKRLAVKEMSGGFRRTTNNRMELLAVITGLEAIRWKNAEVEVWSDSSYVVKAVSEGWLENWKRTGFKKKKNMDLWLRFDAVNKLHRVRFHWLKGHAGHPENERCDALAVAAYHAPDLPEDTGYTEEEQTLI